jgi:uncharacterized protein HemX
MTEIPPPPELPHWPKSEKGPRPTYWLYTEEGGITGPYTKKEARSVVRRNPEETFLSQRDGDGAWHPAETRLQDTKSGGMSVGAIIAMMLVVVLAIAGFKWWQNEKARMAAAKKPIPQQQSAAPAASSSGQ